MRVCVLLALTLPLLPATLHAGLLADQFWPEAKVYIKLSPTSRIYLQAAGTRTREEGYTDGQLGAHMDFYFEPLVKGREMRHPDVARNKMLMIRAGYVYGKTPTNSKDPWTEQTALIEVTPRFFLPKLILVENRLRGDLRFLDGVFTPRFRERLRVERTFKVKAKSLTPYVEVETFYDWRYNSFHRQRYDVGVEWVLRKWLVLEGYYLRQQDSRSSVKGMNVGGLVLQFYFP
ncbi:MAG: DUF2490 domain-containing protein [Acidobacteria bacterium]|nr:DUF2490 domain-containing protein [Acidobacteriota bacterium]